jgi:CotH kinase protein/Lectin C-type domain/Putative metal-binding motif
MQKLLGCCLVTALSLMACGDGSPAGGGSAEAGSERDGARDAGSRVDEQPTDAQRPEVVLDAAALPDGAPLVLGAVRINELDCAGDRVELLNTGDSAASLSGFSIADSVDESFHNQPLSGSIAAGSYQVVTLSGFGISCGDENAVLFRNHEIVDLVLPARIPGGATWGRLPNGSGDFAPTAPTLGAANRAFEDESSALYAPLAPSVEVQITLTAQSRAALVADPRTYVEGGLTLDANGKKLGPLRVGVRLKGHEGSFQDLDHKAAFKVSLDHVIDGQRAFGQKKLTLNNLKQDDTAIHEWLAYRIFAAAGVPAPRVGYAHVTLDGRDYGTYVLVESLDERDFLARNFPSTFATYEPLAGEDITPDKVPTFDVDKGDDKDRSLLLAIAEALGTAPRGGVYDALKARIDYPEVLREMAVELFMGEWDGYTLARNNYLIHIDERGVLRLVPWGADQAFASHESLFYAQGILLTTCLADQTCIPLWIDALKEVRVKVRGLLDAGIVSEARQLAALNKSRFSTDPRVTWDVAGVEARAQAVASELQGRLDDLISDLDCLSTAPDKDGDGRRCKLDCNDDDRALYYGAPEICGDHIDQDCNGAWDDGPSCPVCAADSALPGYLFCPRAATRDAAESACVASHAHLASVAAKSQNDAIAARAALWFSDSPLWIGLRAPANSSSFAWSDGSPLSYDAYAPDEPAGDDSDARCVSLRPEEGRWTASDCYRALPYVCKQ